MKKFVLTGFIILLLNIAFSQTTYNFTGNGNWTVASSWSNNTVPPAILPDGDVINISTMTGGSCILNTTQTISAGASLNIAAGANFIIQGNFTIAGAVTPSVTIGTQVWSLQNLAVSMYRNGDSIPQVADPTAWKNLTTGAWCYNNNDTSVGRVYGKLYNWFAVNDSRGLAPQGWHVPTDAEWTTLVTFLGGEAVAGSTMKTITGWNPPNAGATNSSGFTGLAAGYRYDNGSYVVAGNDAVWWTSTELTADVAWLYELSYFNTKAFRSKFYKKSGYSVRLVKD